MPLNLLQTCSGGAARGRREDRQIRLAAALAEVSICLDATKGLWVPAAWPYG